MDAPPLETSMMRFGWQGVVGHGIWNAQRCIELRTCGSRRIARRASRRVRQMDLERAVTRLPALALVGGPLLTAPLELAMQDPHVGDQPALSGACGLAVAQMLQVPRL